MNTFKRIFSYKFYLFNPFIGLQIRSLDNCSGVNKCKRETPIIVSLTSCEEKFDELPITLYSLLNQELKPDRIILWLNEEENDLTTLPYKITQFIKNGLEIRFVKDIKSYTKAIYAFKEFSSSIIVTANDDIYYPYSWLKKLYLSYVSNPNDIHVHRAYRANLNLPFRKWERHIKEESARFDNFLTGDGGVLYPPNCFTKEVLREDIFLKNAPTTDNIWFWVMALVHNRKIRVVKRHIKTLISTNIFRRMFPTNHESENDTQLSNLMKFYGQNIRQAINTNTLFK